MIGRISRLFRNDRGTSVIELALIAPVIAFMIMGVTDMARGLAAKLKLEQSAQRALEEAAVGSVQTDYSYLGTEAATAAGSGATASVDQWLECDGVRQTDFTGVCADTQMVSRYVKVTVNQSFTPTFTYTSSMWNFLNTRADGTILLAGSSAVRVQ
jgi:Flp pilus assembly pilin Flp